MRSRSLVAGLALASMAFAHGKASAQASCINPDVSWIFCEGFNTGTLPSTVWQDTAASAGGSRIRLQTGTVATGTHALESFSTPGSSAILWASHGFGDHFEWGDGNRVDDLYLSARVRLSDLSVGHRLINVYSFERWDAGYPEPNGFSPYFVMLGFYNETFDSLPRQLHVHIYRRTAGENSFIIPQDALSTFELEPDRWYAITMRLKANDPGISNGVLEVGVDGVSVITRGGLNFRDDYDLYGWNHLMLTTDVGMTTTQSVFYDDVILSSAPITDPGDPDPPIDPVCGNGLIEGNEPCDDGNVSNRDGCLNGCIRAACGDGYVQRDVEECDDGNSRDGDRCTSECQHAEAPPPRDNAASSESSGCNVSHGLRGSHVAWSLLFLAVFGPSRRTRDRISG